MAFNRSGYKTMPPGKWAVQVQSIKGHQVVDGNDILIHPHGWLFYMPGATDAHEPRWCFFPHHRVERMWQVAVDGEGV